MSIESRLRHVNISRRARLLSLPVTGLVVLTLGVSGCSSETSSGDATASSSAASTDEPATPGSTTGAVSPADAASASAEWLAHAAAAPGAFETEYEGVVYPDDGLRADVVLSLLAAGDATTAGTVAAPLVDPVAVSTYVGDGQATLYAGSTAKLAAVVSALGQDPYAVGGRDLVAELQAQQAPSGRFTDLGEADYSHTISQSWAVLALSAVDEAPPAAVEFLATQQCASGGFPAQLSDAPTGDCEADVDATAFAISALTAADGDFAARAAALAWLAETADEGGSWAAAGTTEPSVNSTSVVAAAFADAGQDATRALDWLAGQAIADGTDAGAFPLAAGDDAGDLRATAQAVLALSGSGLAQVLDVQG